MAKDLYPPKEYPDGHQGVAISLGWLGLLLNSQGKYAEAEPFYRDALAMYQRLHGINGNSSARLTFIVIS